MRSKETKKSRQSAKGSNKFSESMRADSLAGSPPWSFSRSFPHEAMPCYAHIELPYIFDMAGITPHHTAWPHRNRSGSGLKRRPAERSKLGETLMWEIMSVTFCTAMDRLRGDSCPILVPLGQFTGLFQHQMWNPCQPKTNGVRSISFSVWNESVHPSLYRFQAAERQDF